MKKDKNNFHLDKFLMTKNLKIEKKFLRYNRLEFLKNFVLKKRRLKIIEFGTGISTLVIAKALYINKKKYSNLSKEFRGINFKLYTVDNNRKFLNITKKNIDKLKLKKFVSLSLVKLSMGKFDGQIVASCNKIPNISPDLIYLDGPDQSLIKGNYKNVNFSDKSFTPIQSDILKMESYLIPGTFILIDGRSNNAYFLKRNLRRNWKYKFYKSLNTHLFELKEPPLGNYNKRLNKFYNFGK